MKTVYGWVVEWGEGCTPRISIDLFFSSPEVLKKISPWVDLNKEQLIPVQVPDEFDVIDFIPENY